jgi:hypothetical protein
MNRKILICLAATLLVAAVPLRSANAMQSSRAGMSQSSTHTLGQSGVHRQTGTKLVKLNAHSRAEPWNSADLGG